MSLAGTEEEEQLDAGVLVSWARARLRLTIESDEEGEMCETERRVGDRMDMDRLVEEVEECEEKLEAEGMCRFSERGS